MKRLELRQIGFGQTGHCNASTCQAWLMRSSHFRDGSLGGGGGEAPGSGASPAGVGAIVGAAESILGRTWGEMTEGYGDWGRDGTMAVATRHLGWRLVEVMREEGQTVSPQLEEIARMHGRGGGGRSGGTRAGGTRRGRPELSAADADWSA